MSEETIKMLNIINDKIKKCMKANDVNTLFAIPLGAYGEFGYLTDKMLNEIIQLQQEKAKLQKIINKTYKCVEELEDDIKNFHYYDLTRQAKRKILTSLRGSDINE